jgi:hypothetical protein
VPVYELQSHANNPSVPNSTRAQSEFSAPVHELPSH